MSQGRGYGKYSQWKHPNESLLVYPAWEDSICAFLCPMVLNTQSRNSIISCAQKCVHYTWQKDLSRSILHLKQQPYFGSPTCTRRLLQSGVMLLLRKQLSPYHYLFHCHAKMNVASEKPPQASMGLLLPNVLNSARQPSRIDIRLNDM